MTVVAIVNQKGGAARPPWPDPWPRRDPCCSWMPVPRAAPVTGATSTPPDPRTCLCKASLCPFRAVQRRPTEGTNWRGCAAGVSGEQSYARIRPVQRRLTGESAPAVTA